MISFKSLWKPFNLSAYNSIGFCLFQIGYVRNEYKKSVYLIILNYSIEYKTLINKNYDQHNETINRGKTA